MASYMELRGATHCDFVMIPIIFRDARSTPSLETEKATGSRCMFVTAATYSGLSTWGNISPVIPNMARIPLMN